MNTEPLDVLPLWAFFTLTLAVVYGTVEIGYRLGLIRRRISETENAATVGPIIGATIGLLAFMSAFTFGLAATRFDARRQIVVEEANAIGTTYLRAGLLPEPYPAQVRALLREYASVRLEAVQTGDVQRAIEQSTALHDQLWLHAEKLAEADRHSIMTGAFVESLNEMIDLHAKRVQIAIRSRVSIIIWATLYAVAIFSMIAIGYQIGIAGSRRSSSVAALALTFSLVMLLIADLDRPREGLIRVSQQAILDLQNSWKQPAE